MNYPFGGEDILRPVELTDRSDPEPGTEAFTNALVRDESTRHIGAMPWLPQLPDEWAYELHGRIDEAERRYAAPNRLKDEYLLGTATEADEIALVQGSGTYLFTAEHATKTVRAATGQIGFADTGTAGLAAVLAEDLGSALIMRGRQTSNPATDPNHPMKREISRLLPKSTGFLGVHGKNPGMFVHDSDRAEIHAVIGLGAEPSEAALEFADKITLMARDLFGLYVVTANKQAAYIQHEKQAALKRLEDGQAKQSRLAASKPNMSVGYVTRELAAAGRTMPVQQVELTSMLRATPNDTNEKDEKSRIIGVALGYQLLSAIVELSRDETSLANTEKE